MSTETELREWRGGQTNAERLCAAILSIDGYVDVDPQGPLGGPDDKKDILARRDGDLYVGAVFFPPTDNSFTEIEKKFLEDREGVARHDAQAFAFFVNKRLTLGERGKLLDQGGALDELYHLERLRSVLDSPAGYGLRLEYLRKAMTVEEQVAFFSTLQAGVAERRLDSQRAEAKLDVVLQRTESILDAVGGNTGPSSLVKGDLVGDYDRSLSDLTVANLRLLHRAVTEGASVPDEVRGALRSVRVWIGSAEDPIYEPPPPEEVASRLVELLNWWRDAYPSLASGELPGLVEGLARLHYGLVAIHPFVDANGRLARFVTDQAARELANRGVGRELIEDRAAYFEALKKGDAGDLGGLQKLIRAALD